MANPRQRRKAKSSAHKAISHSRRAKRLQKKMPSIRGPKSLQDAWDPCKTIRQNYLSLGLQHDLNPIASGGSEINPVRTTDQIDTSLPQSASSLSSIHDAHSQSSASESPAVISKLPKGFGRIIRDPSGNVIGVELPDDEETMHASRQASVIDTPVVMKESELRMWAEDRTATWQGNGSRTMHNSIIQDLQNLSASATVRERHTSLGERLYLERLVNKHGDDPDKMARDRRLNPEQRTASELKKAIAKAGGLGALCKSTGTDVAGVA